MSMNPARSFASAAPSAQWHAFWIYLVAPVTGMLIAGQCFLRRATGCAKLLHPTNQRCIHCGHQPDLS
jgi:aquaporin Z